MTDANQYQYHYPQTTNVPYSPAPQAPYSPMPYGFQPAPQNGLGTAGLVLGIVGLVLVWIPVLGLVLGLLAIIFGGIGLSKSRKGSATNGGMAVAGLVLGILTVAIPVVMWIALAAAISGATPGM